MNKRFEMQRIKIAFNPQKEVFATQTAAIVKDPTWIDDIATMFVEGFSEFSFVTEFAEKNGYSPDAIAPVISHLRNLTNNEIGNIQLSEHLGIDAVTEIFNRINSKGTVLSSADFIMSKLSADSEHHGDLLRKTVEYFTRLLRDGAAINDIRDHDIFFSNTDYYHWIEWSAKEDEDLYLPEFGDIFHIILNVQFNRGKHADLISLVSGRDFSTKQYTEEAMDETYKRLSAGIQLVTDQSNFQRYLMILRGMGMLGGDKLHLQGTGALNFGYALYLLLKDRKDIDYTHAQIENIVRRWLILSILTQRYSGSSETQTEMDIKKFRNNSPVKVLEDAEESQLNDDFWETALPQRLTTSSAVTNLWRLFLMAQVKSKSTLWLDSSLMVSDAIVEQGNIHHIFPKAYLKAHGFEQSQFNQIGNYVFLSQPRNLQISNQAPKVYLNDSRITQYATPKNFADNAIPQSLSHMDYTQYSEFLVQRRQLMAAMIKSLYFSFALS